MSMVARARSAIGGLVRRSVTFAWTSGVASLVAVVLVAALQACASPAPRDLSTLDVVDSLYVDRASGAPFTGPVFRRFADAPERMQVEGALLDGTWHGEFRVYHVNGRIRYMGSFDSGSRCGAWTENADSLPDESVYEELLDEIESLGMYPPCPGP